MNPQNKKDGASEPRYEFDPFADPRTIPHGWDLSEMFKAQEKNNEATWNDPNSLERDGLDL